jgi:iron complex outermembrane receptor protein
MGVIEMRPDDTIHATLDVFYSKFTETQQLRGMEIPLAPNWTGGAGNPTVLQPGFTIEDGLHTHAVISNVQPVIRNDIFEREAKPFAIGLNLVFNEREAWPVTFDLGYSRVHRFDDNLETWSGLGFRDQPGPSDTITVDIEPGRIPEFTSALDYSTGTGLRLTDPQGWGSSNLPGGGMQGYYKGFDARDTLTQVKLSTRHALDGAISGVEFGVSATDRSKREGEDPSGFIVAANSQPGVPATQPLPPQIGTTDLGFLGLGEVYAYDPRKAFLNGTWDFVPNLDGGIVANRYNISEQVYQVYGQLDLDSQMGSVPVSGNVGLRAIYTDQSTSGFSANGNNLNPVEDKDTYLQIAPSLNLNFKPAENTFVRFSVARQIARPRMYDMRASRTWSFDTQKAGNTNLQQSPWSGGGGNPALRPWDSYSIDVSVEKYFSEGRGYVALAGYYKSLRNFIYQQNEVADFSQYPVSSGAVPNLFEGIISTPVNGKGGSIKGFEASISLPSELFNREIKGFGLVAGAAYTDSSVEPWGPGNGTAPIAGLSDWVTNVTVYYERGGFSIRLSDRYRSENRQYITTFGVPNRSGDVNPNGGFSVAQPENVIDGQVSYTFTTDNQLNGLTVYLQAYNLNNEPLVTYNNGDPRQVINYQKYGASYSAGVSYKF